LDRGDFRVRLKFTLPEASGSGATDLASLLASMRAAAPAPAAPVATAPAPAAPAADPNEGLHIVKSPIVGTYYGSPSPGASPFVAVGDRVEKAR